MTTRLALVGALILATSAANAQAPRARQAPASPPTKPTAPGAPHSPPTQDVPDPARLQAFSTTPFYKGLITRAMDGIPPEMFQRCPGLVSNGSSITVLRPLHFTDDVPVAGVWRHSFPVSGCGTDTVLNFYFIATPEKRINTVLGMLGTTRADPMLQHDAQQYAVAGATAALNESGASPCASYAVRNTKFEGYGLEDPPTPDPGPGEPRRPWRESWTVAGCGHTFLVPLSFAPREVGTGIMQPGHITELAPSEVAQAVPPPPSPLAPAGVPPVAPPSSPEPAAANFAALPGSTHANLRQQREAQTRTIGAAALAVQDQGGTPCPSYAITNTKFEAFGLENPPSPDPGAAAPDRPWWESWTAAGCGRQFLVPLNFIPHGGIIDIVQPGHVTQPLLVDPSQIRNPYAKDEPPTQAAPPAAPSAGKP